MTVEIAINCVIFAMIIGSAVYILMQVIKLEEKFDDYRNTVDNWVSHIATSVTELSDRIENDPVLDRDQIEAKTREEMEKVADKVMTEWTQNIISYNPYAK